MKQLRLCIGSNNNIDIASSHMGDTEFFHIFNLFQNLEYEFVEKRANTARDMGHAKAEKMKEIIKIIEDADIFVAKEKSPNFMRIANKTKYQPVVVKAQKITKILELLGKSFEDIYTLVEKRKAGESFPTIPELA